LVWPLSPSFQTKENPQPGVGPAWWNAFKTDKKEAAGGVRPAGEGAKGWVMGVSGRALEPARRRRDDGQWERG